MPVVDVNLLLQYNIVYATELRLSLQEGNFAVGYNPRINKLHADMMANFEKKCFQVCDSRAVEKFSGP